MNKAKFPDSRQLADLVSYLSGFVTDDRIKRIEAVLEMRTRHVNVVLEDLYQPHNASAVMRSCDAFGVQNLHIIEDQHRFKPLSGIAVGAEKWLTLQKYRGNNALEHCLSDLQSKGYRLIATSPKPDYPSITEIEIDRKISLMFGAELTGLSDEAFEKADIICRIPMVGFTESFNISVSVAICLYELTRKIRASGVDWRLSEDEKLFLRYEWLKKSIRAGDHLVQDYLDGNS